MDKLNINTTGGQKIKKSNKYNFHKNATYTCITNIYYFSPRKFRHISNQNK